MSNRRLHSEEWLAAAVAAMRPWFEELKLPLPSQIVASRGFLKFSKSNAIGQCWDPKASIRGANEIFICPRMEDPVQILSVLLHELCHAAVGVEHQHKKPFREAVRRFGLAGKPTATYAEEGSEIHAKLTQLAESLGPYPGAPMRLARKPKSGDSYMRLVSVNDESYKVNIKKSLYEEFGAPTDPWGDEMEPLK